MNWDWVSPTVTVLGGIGVALATFIGLASAIGALSSTARLRSGIRADQEIVKDAAPGAEREALEASIAQRISEVAKRTSPVEKEKQNVRVRYQPQLVAIGGLALSVAGGAVLTTWEIARTPVGNTPSVNRHYFYMDAVVVNLLAIVLLTSLAIIAVVMQRRRGR